MVTFITFPLRVWTSHHTPPAKPVALKADVRTSLRGLRVISGEDARYDSENDLLSEFAVIGTMPLSISISFTRIVSLTRSTHTTFMALTLSVRSHSVAPKMTHGEMWTKIAQNILAEVVDAAS